MTYENFTTNDTDVSEKIRKGANKRINQVKD